MSEIWIIKDTAPVDDMVFARTPVSFTSAGKEFYSIECKKITSYTRYQISLFGQYTGGGSTMATTGYYTSRDPVPAFQTWYNTAYKTMVFNEPPTGDLLTWLQKNAYKQTEYLTNTSELTAVADAIRAKGGTSEQLVYPAGFVSAIQAIEDVQTVIQNSWDASY